MTMPINDISSGLAQIGTEVANARAETARLGQAAARAKRARDAHDEEGRKSEASQGFEQIFSTLLAKEMRRGLSEGFFGSGPGADTFSAWLDEYVGQAIAARDTLGLERMLEDTSAFRIQTKVGENGQ